MNTKKYFLVLLLILAGVHLKTIAQTVDRTVIANGGGHAQAGAFQLNWTFGEIATETFSPSYQLNQGFQQSFSGSNGVADFTNVSATKRLKRSFQVNAFPNPCRNMLTVTNSEPQGVVQLRVVNVNGQIVWEGTMINQKRIDTSLWLAGAYFLQMISKDNDVNILPIHKIH